MSVYEKVKELCVAKNITITALERDLGWGRGSIGKLQKGGNTSTERLQALAEYFGVSTDYLLGVQNSGQQAVYYIDDEAAQIGQAIFENPDLRALFHTVQGIRKKDINLLIDMGKRLKETNPDG